MQHLGAQFLQHKERQQHKQEQGYHGLPRIDKRITVQCQIDVYQEVMPQGEQYRQCL